MLAVVRDPELCEGYPLLLVYSNINTTHIVNVICIDVTQNNPTFLSINMQILSQEISLKFGIVAKTALNLTLCPWNGLGRSGSLILCIALMWIIVIAHLALHHFCCMHSVVVAAAIWVGWTVVHQNSWCLGSLLQLLA